MTNTFAIWFGACILILLGLDWGLTGSENTLFLLKKLSDFIEYIAFWR